MSLWLLWFCEQYYSNDKDIYYALLFYEMDLKYQNNCWYMTAILNIAVYTKTWWNMSQVSETMEDTSYISQCDFHGDFIRPGIQ